MAQTVKPIDPDNPNTLPVEEYGLPPGSIDGIMFTETEGCLFFDNKGFIKNRQNWGQWLPELKRWRISSCDGEIWMWNSHKSVWEVDEYLYSEWHQQFPDSHKQTFAQRCELYK